MNETQVLFIELLKFGTFTFGRAMDYTLNPEGREQSNYLGCHNSFVEEQTLEAFILKCAGIFFWGTSDILDDVKV